MHDTVLIGSESETEGGGLPVLKTTNRESVLMRHRYMRRTITKLRIRIQWTKSQLFGYRKLLTRYEEM